jgi:hypothetical protein
VINRLLILLAFTGSFAFALVLSGSLIVPPRPIFLFDTDFNEYTAILSGARSYRPSPLHALINVVYRPPCSALAGVLTLVAPRDQARALAARALLASAFAVGFTAVTVLAADLTGSRRKAACVGVLSLLFTSNIVASLPETYGLSFGLLAMAALVTWSPLRPGRKAAALAVLALLCAGTTVTNGLYPLGGLVALYLRPPERGGLRPAWLTPWRQRLALGLVAAAALAAACAVPALGPALRKATPGLYAHLSSWLHLRLVREPAVAAREWGKALVYPAVGPYPSITPGSVTYGATRAATWTWAHAAAAAAWCGLIAWGAVRGCADRVTRPFALGLLAWLGFNLGLHAIWGGPDNYLYTPNWSWALMTLAALGARWMPLPALLAVCLVIAPAQVVTLFHIARENAAINP